MDQANPAEYSPRPRFSIQPLVVIAIGTVLVFIGALVLYHFANNPVGLLPGIAGWKGGPMLLCAGFCCSLGALLIVRRRFSLGIFVIGAVLSSLLSAGATAYMHSMRQEDPFNLELRVRPDDLARLREDLCKSLTSARLDAFGKEIVSRKYADEIDYGGIHLSIGSKPGTEDILVVNVTFEWNPYLHPQTNNIRVWILRYAQFLSAWERERHDKQKIKDLEKWMLALGWKLDRTQFILSHLKSKYCLPVNEHRWSGDSALLRNRFVAVIQDLTTAEIGIRYNRALETKSALSTTNSGMPGLAKFLEIETDAEIKAFTEQVQLAYGKWLDEHPPYTDMRYSTTATGAPMMPRALSRVTITPAGSGTQMRKPIERIVDE